MSHSVLDLGPLFSDEWHGPEVVCTLREEWNSTPVKEIG